MPKKSPWTASMAAALAVGVTAGITSMTPAVANDSLVIDSAPGKMESTEFLGKSGDVTNGYTFRLDSIPEAGVYNRVLARASGTTGYSVVVRSGKHNNGYLQLERIENGQVEILGGTHVEAPQAHENYRLELRVVGQDKADVSARVYREGQDAPQWQVTHTDNEPLNTSGSGVGVKSYVSSRASQPVQVEIKDVTSADGNGDNATPVQQVDPQDHNESSTYVEGWGEAVFNEDFNDPELEQWNVQDDDYVGYDVSSIHKENVQVADGNLVLQTKRLDESIRYKGDGWKERTYSTGYINTIGKFSQEYGRYEIRAKLPTVKGKSKGIWPAFWLRPDDGKNPGEVDIFEAFGTPVDPSNEFDTSTRTLATVHYNQENKGHTRKAAPTPEDIDVNDGQFHTWTLEWTPDSMNFFVDGKHYLEIKASDDERWNSVFKGHKYHMRVNTQVGSDYWGMPNDKDTARSVDYVVDYVRAWEYQGG